MTTTIAEPDWDTRTNAYLEQQVDDAIEEMLDDALCCMKDCEALATARGVLFPCFDIGEYCQPHRAQIMRVRAVMLRIYGFQNCGRCGRKVDDVLWERIT